MKAISIFGASHKNKYSKIDENMTKNLSDLWRSEQSNVCEANFRTDASPDSEQIEHNATKLQMRNSVSVEEIQDNDDKAEFVWAKRVIPPLVEH